MWLRVAKCEEIPIEALMIYVMPFFSSVRHNNIKLALQVSWVAYNNEEMYNSLKDAKGEIIMAKGYIYIMTNPALHDMVKIGYATNVEARRQQLSTTALPYEYEIYATYETSGNLEDKKLHKLIDNLNADLRVSKSREFFIMTPHEAYELLEAIATISGSQDKLKILKGNIGAPTQIVRRPSIDFYKCGLKDGDELICIEDSTIRVIIKSEHKVLYNNELTSLSAIMKSLKGYSVAGPSYFTYNNELLTDIAERTQWRE